MQVRGGERKREQEKEAHILYVLVCPIACSGFSKEARSPFVRPLFGSLPLCVLQFSLLRCCLLLVSFFDRICNVNPESVKNRRRKGKNGLDNYTMSTRLPCFILLRFTIFLLIERPHYFRYPLNIPRIPKNFCFLIPK